MKIHEPNISSFDKKKYSGFSNFFLTFENYLPWISVLFFLFGIFWARKSLSFAFFVNELMTSFVDSYSYIAPAAIYLILTPTLIKLFTLGEKSGKRFTNRTIIWFAKIRLMGCLFAVFATSLAFDLPFYSGQSDFSINQLLRFFSTFFHTLTHSSYFYAVYASILTVCISFKYRPLARLYAKGVDLIEYVGNILVFFVPFFMMGVGAYVTIIPEILESKIGTQLSQPLIGTVTILHIDFDINTSWGMIMVYTAGAFLTGMVSSLWHCILLIMAKMTMPALTLKKYLSVYWLKIYPLLWATSSEALSTPLNLYLFKKLCPMIHSEVRQLVIVIGSVVNINGTLINVFIMTGLVAEILGIKISFLQLLAAIPIVFLTGYAIPGIPGELLLFAGPVATCMSISPELLPVFLSLYIGLQIGLPDSFRTGSNSTDDCPSAIILHQHYLKIVKKH